MSMRPAEPGMLRGKTVAEVMPPKPICYISRGEKLKIPMSNAMMNVTSRESPDLLVWSMFNCYPETSSH